MIAINASILAAKYGKEAEGFALVTQEDIFVQFFTGKDRAYGIRVL